MDVALAVALCLLMEALFAGSEMVLVSADRHRLTERARRGERGARTAVALLEKPDGILATTLTGTNLAVVLNSVLVTSRLLDRFGDRAAWVAVGIVAPLVFLFGETVPKSFARSRADALAGAAARFVWLARIALYPLVALVSLLSRAIASPFGGVPPLRGMVTREELRLILQMSRSGSDVEPHERIMVRRVFHFGEKRVADIFRPLAQVAALPEGAACRDAAGLAARTGYTRYPVFRERVDHVVGFLHVLDTIGHPPDAPVAPLLRKALFVPDLMPVDELMRAFRSAGTSFAVVVDEYGGVTGLVTAEDVVEEVVGEIEDEYDRRMEYYRKITPAEFLVPGRMETGRFEEEFRARLPEGDYATVGGMLIAMAGRIPAPGESFEIPDAVFTVEKASDRAVQEVRVRLRRPAPGGPGSGKES